MFLKEILCALTAVCALAGCAGAPAQQRPQPKANPAAEEKPVSLESHHAYHQSLVYKMFLANKEHPEADVLTFADALDVIRRVHGRTAGVKQIVYLVGWQFDGHDSKYPAWSEVNRRLKRPQDATALESLLWLMREAKRYNAVVSMHVNMNDAYENSPLWDEYVKNDLLVRDADGTLHKGAQWGGEQSYPNFRSLRRGKIFLCDEGAVLGVIWGCNGVWGLLAAQEAL